MKVKSGPPHWFATSSPGVPLLPSGVLYLQGAPLSYLLAPLLWLGVGGVANPTALRLIPAACGVAAVYFTYRATLALTASSAAAVGAAAALAIDPLSAQWSAHVRMYAPEQMVAMLLAWAVFLVLAEPTRARIAALVGLSWLAVYTHAVGLLLLPGAVLALVLAAHAARRARRGLVLGAGACALAPLTLLVLNRASGLGRRTPSEAGADLPFVGAQVLDFDRLRHPTFVAWTRLFDLGRFGAWLPHLILVSSAILAAWCLVGIGVGSTDRRVRSFGGLVLLVLYWLPVVAVAGLTSADQDRYLVDLHPLEYAFVAAATALFLPTGREVRHLPRRGVVGALAVAVLTVPVLVFAATGLRARWERPVVSPDYPAAFAFVAAHRTPGEPVLVSLPPIAYLTLAGDDDLVFLAGRAEEIRTRRYSWRTAGGRVVDYWLGIDAIASTADLCAALAAHPDAWLVVDDDRVGAPWAFSEPMAHG
jgi:hypothetical protein